MSRSGDFCADDRQQTDRHKPIALPLAAHAFKILNNFILALKIDNQIQTDTQKFLAYTCTQLYSELASTKLTLKRQRVQSRE
jgi:hypothetical protein